MFFIRPSGDPSERNLGRYSVAATVEIADCDRCETHTKCLITNSTYDIRQYELCLKCNKQFTSGGGLNSECNKCKKGPNIKDNPFKDYAEYGPIILCFVCIEEFKNAECANEAVGLNDH